MRALMIVLEGLFPNWTQLDIHESSPAGPASERLARDCPRYLATHYFPGIKPGAVHQGFRCEDLEAMTFPDGRFDLVITQDVFEHVFEKCAGAKTDSLFS